MGAQTDKSSYIFPDGCALEVSTDSGVSWENMGVLSGGVTVTHNFDKEEIESGNKSKISSKIKNETLALEPTELWTWDLNAIQKISAGIYTVENVAGTIVSGATQTVESGDWLYDMFIPIENQNGSGGAITVNSVTGGTDGVITVDSDYTLGKNALGVYGMFIEDGATLTTESQDLVIDYDYTPSEGKRLKSGSTSVVLTKFYARLTHYTDAALTTFDAQMTVYGVDTNSGLGFTWKGSNEEGVNSFQCSLTGSVDTTKTDGEGLFDLYIKTSALTS